MNNNATEELYEVLGEIGDRIKLLESSPNRMLVLIESDTLTSFHWFNLCFKRFWNGFDRHSVSQLLQYQEVLKEHSDYSHRYLMMFQEQNDYLTNVIDISNNYIPKDIAPFIFTESDGLDVINYYNKSLENKKDKEGNPLYIIEQNTNSRIRYIDEAGNPKDSYVFKSDYLNYSHYKSLMGMSGCLKYLYDLMCVISSYPNQLVLGYKTTQEEILRELEQELRQYAREVGSKIKLDLKRTAQYLKPYRNSSLTPDVWGLVMNEEDRLFDLAIAGQIGDNEEKQLEHISATKEQLIDNFSLLQKIKATCIDEELFDIRLSVQTHQLLTSLNADNLDLFYELVLRRNLIQCEMFPKLKKQHEVWLTSLSVDNDMPQVDDEERENNEEPAEEELFHFIHPEIDEDEERWRIHKAIKRLVAHQKVPEICTYLKEQKQKDKLYLPPNPSFVYEELKRLGMPTGDGYSEKYFAGCYKNITLS